MRFLILFLFITKVYSDIFCTTVIPKCIDCPSNQINIIIPQNSTHCSYCLCADSIIIEDDTIIINNNIIINDTSYFLSLNFYNTESSNAIHSKESPFLLINLFLLYLF